VTLMMKKPTKKTRTKTKTRRIRIRKIGKSKLNCPKLAPHSTKCSSQITNKKAVEILLKNRGEGIKSNAGWPPLTTNCPPINLLSNNY